MSLRSCCVVGCLSSSLLASVGLAQEVRPTAAELVSRGEAEFLAGEIDASVQSFQRAIELVPRIEPQLWQLGISYYYAGKFKQGRELFESHQTVNPHDVENAAWHFLCVARSAGMKAAEQALLNIDTHRDTRVPMTEVYELYAGRGKAEAVLAAAKEADSERARMYAHLYLGLYYEVSEQPDLARKHLQESAAAKLSRNYMQGVAKVHALLLERQAKQTQPASGR